MKTKEELFNENIGLIYKVINDKFAQFKGTEHYDDLVSEGYVGLLKAIDKFDINRGEKVSSLAYMYIYSGITLYVYTKIYQMKKTTKKIDNKSKTVFLSVNLSYYDSTDNGEDYLKCFEEIDENYNHAENSAMTSLMLVKLKELENIGPRRYKGIYDVINLMLQEKTSKEIAKILNTSQMSVNRKQRYAIDILKEYFNVA